MANEIIVEYTKRFQKQYIKLTPKLRIKFKQSQRILLVSPNNSTLNNHALRGKYQGFYSINVTGDVRALYAKKGSAIIIFSFIGTHSQLYG